MNSCQDYKEQADVSYKKQIEDVIEKNNKIEAAVSEFIELINIDEIDDLDMQQLMTEQQNRQNQNYENFLKESELKKFKASSVQATLFLKKLGHKKLWRPDKYKGSRKVKVAETFEELVIN